jgi:peptidoglycan biosynthesis protein MviN/MurJ (putative lipid II flippase)
LVARLVNIAVFLGLGLVLFRPMGAFGIALANSLAFTAEAVLLLAWLGRQFPSILRHGRTALRAILGSALGGSAAYAVVAASPGGNLVTGILALAVGGALCLPFIWPEVKEIRAL